MIASSSDWTGSPLLAGSCHLSSCVLFSTHHSASLLTVVFVYFYHLCDWFYVLFVFFWFCFFIPGALILRLPSRGPLGLVFSPCRGSFLMSLRWQEFMHEHTERNKKEQTNKETNSGRRTDAKRQDGGERGREREVMQHHPETSTAKTNTQILHDDRLRLWSSIPGPCRQLSIIKKVFKKKKKKKQADVKISALQELQASSDLR